jgi:hypothetical protein
LATGWIDPSAWPMRIMSIFHKISPWYFWTETNNAKHVRVEY